MTTYNPPHYRDENIWENIPETENERLQQTLSIHLRNMNVKKTKSERNQIVKEMLKKQNNTCAFGKNVGGKWCWNESKVNFTKPKNEKDGEYVELKYIKLLPLGVPMNLRDCYPSVSDKPKLSFLSS